MDFLFVVDMSDLKSKALITSADNLQIPRTTSISPSNGSATGNPRNKCALKPGYSLMSWIRLCKSGTDLSGTAGKILPVTNEELARHNNVNDAWLAIRGKVFNVTRYMEFHPGGVNELLRGTGKDATKLFDEVHAWVNYPQLLEKCYVGPLKNDCHKMPLKLSDPPSFPRFDWMQQRSEVILCIHTYCFANPGILLKHKTTEVKTGLDLLVYVDKNWHQFYIELTGAVYWPPKTVYSNVETGKLEIVLRKQMPVSWSSYGTIKSIKVEQALKSEEEMYNFQVLRKVDLNHNSFEFNLQSVGQEAMLIVPIGYHVTFQLNFEGVVLERSYTPVPHKYMSANGLSSASEASTSLDFLIKRNAFGKISPRLYKLQEKDIVRVSLPYGKFLLNALALHRNILLVAAGSGITPMLGLFEPLLKRNINRIERLLLMYFNKTPLDIWVHDKLRMVEVDDERFCLLNIHSYANMEQFKPLIKNTTTSTFTYVAICGPDGFNSTVLEILKELNFNMNQLQVF
ncbi:cytochrome b5 reductase 4 [Scaptodrosophila lebanonensis]|uniref:Cytochrome b5 reductase 4 n=1 Tax=Drosophila lebanonensis TaxID=7225 RepID=A0A6J2U061_DROLE|nr:cytochrome b5 reductase 4 [Scaptodrosophila lebanonensis]